MSITYTPVIQQDGDWWIGWIEEIPGINCQERTREELIESIDEAVSEWRWDELFRKTQPQLTAAAHRVRREIAEGKSEPLDLDKL